MNNIEILEERINFCKNNTECREELKQCFGCTFEIEEIQAIENLIQENKNLKKQIPSPTNPIPIEYQTDIWVLKRDYISKSKIEEKIKKLKILAEKSDDETLNACELDIRKNQIYLLKSLLEEGE